MTPEREGEKEREGDEQRGEGEKERGDGEKERGEGEKERGEGDEPPAKRYRGKRAGQKNSRGERWTEKPTPKASSSPCKAVAEFSKQLIIDQSMGHLFFTDNLRPK